MRKTRVLYLSSWAIGRGAEGKVSFIHEQIDALAPHVEAVYLEHGFAGVGRWLVRFAKRELVETNAEFWPDQVHALRIRTARFSTRITRRTFLEDIERAGAKVAKRLSSRGVRPDLVHAHVVLPGGLLGAAIASYFKVPLVVQEHSAPFEMHLDTEEKVRLTRKVFTSAARVAPVGHDLALRLEKHGVPRSKIVVLPEMVATNRFRPHPFPRTRTPLRIISVGSLIERKGFDVILRAVARLRELGIDLHLTIVGGGTLRSKLADLCRDLDLDDTVTFRGHLDRTQTAAAMAEAHLYVCASRRETFGIAPAEALAVGRPVVTTACGGPEEFVTGDTGCVVPIDDVESLANGIVELANRLDTFDPHELHRSIDSRFGPAQFSSRLLALYQEILNTRMQVRPA